MEKTTRATKKQRELLAFIDGFIKGNGYGPSYREIMRALGYKSVSTVAVHIDGLITAGYIRKKDRSARSIEVVQPALVGVLPAQDSNHEQWLRQAVAARFKNGISNEQAKILYDAMEILGISLPDSVSGGDKSISGV